MPPAVTVAGPDFVTERLADAVTVVLTESELFVKSGSAVVEAIDAELVNDPALFGAVTTIVKVVDAPEFQFARVHVTEVLPLLLHDQPPFDGDTDTNVTPAGNVSTNDTFEEHSDGPRLLAATV